VTSVRAGASGRGTRKRQLETRANSIKAPGLENVEKSNQFVKKMLFLKAQERKNLKPEPTQAPRMMLKKQTN